MGLQLGFFSDGQGLILVSQNWRKPDCGIATSRPASTGSVPELVRIGGSPIVGLQPKWFAPLWEFPICVRIGGSPIVGLQPSARPMARTRRRGQNWRKPDCGIATVSSLALPEQLAPRQNWRKPDCGIATVVNAKGRFC